MPSNRLLPNKKQLKEVYGAVSGMLKNKLAPYFSDYGQLIEKGSPLNNDFQNLKQRVSRHIPSNEDFRSPEAMRDWSQAAALNAPMGLSLSLGQEMLKRHMELKNR